MRSMLACFGLVFFFVAGQGLAIAQTIGSPGTVNVRGTAAIGRLATGMRISGNLIGQGPSEKEALKELQKSTAVGKKKFLELGAQVDSIHIGTPILSNISVLEAADELAQPLLSPVPPAGAAPAITPAGPTERGKEIHRKYLASSAVSAEWKLKATTADELILETAEVLKPVVVVFPFRIVYGSPYGVPAVPYSAQAAAVNFSSDGAWGNSFSVQYFAPITPAERATLLSKAFESARSKAALLAKTAHCELGKVASISDENDLMTKFSPYGVPPVLQEDQRDCFGRSLSNDDAEAVSTSKIEPTYAVKVLVTFELKSDEK